MAESDELAWLRAVCEAATPGPWEPVEGQEGSKDHVGATMPQLVGSMGDSYTEPPHILRCYGWRKIRERNARAIAALGTLAPHLLAVVEAAADPAMHGAAPAIAGRDGDRMRAVAAAAQGQAVYRLCRALDALRAAIREHRGDGDE